VQTFKRTKSDEKKQCGWQLLLSMVGSIQLCPSHLSQWSVFPPHPLSGRNSKERMGYLFNYKFILISLWSSLNNTCSYTFKGICNVKLNWSCVFETNDLSHATWSCKILDTCWAWLPCADYRPRHF
jgi:hypothetical protein